MPDTTHHNTPHHKEIEPTEARAARTTPQMLPILAASILIAVILIGVAFVLFG